ncbi:MAG: hypothetical protein Ct9H300mP7_2110 [Verrucomicrobiota bacterium]|nr:MAG: hypothetical protein Ct9H300mP7_2110 [Verrucomicrobiota bacterium]
MDVPHLRRDGAAAAGSHRFALTLRGDDGAGDGASGVVAPYIEQAEQVSNCAAQPSCVHSRVSAFNDALAGQSLPGDLADYAPGFNENNLSSSTSRACQPSKTSTAFSTCRTSTRCSSGRMTYRAASASRSNTTTRLFLETAETIFTKARAKGIGAGIHAWGDTASQARFVNMGANLLIHKADIIFFKNGVRDELTDIRSKLGFSQATPHR